MTCDARGFMATLCDSNLYVHQQEQGQLLDSDAALVNLPATPPSRRPMYQTQSVYCCAHYSNHSKPPTHASEQTGRLACCKTRSPAKCRSLSCFFASEWRYALECVALLPSVCGLPLTVVACRNCKRSVTRSGRCRSRLLCPCQCAHASWQVRHQRVRQRL